MRNSHPEQVSVQPDKLQLCVMWREATKLLSALAADCWARGLCGPALGLLRSGLRAPQLPRRTAGRPGHGHAHTDRESTAPFRGRVSPHNYVHCN